MNSNGYEAKVTNASKELTARERIMLKELTNAIQLDEATQTADLENAGNLVIKPVYFAEVSVHNEKSDSKDYTKFVIVDDNGTKFVTGSDSFKNAFMDIWSEMAEANETDFEIEVYRKESKNYKGKSFISCSLK